MQAMCPGLQGRAAAFKQKCQALGGSAGAETRQEPPEGQALRHVGPHSATLLIVPTAKSTGENPPATIASQGYDGGNCFIFKRVGTGLVRATTSHRANPALIIFVTRKSDKREAGDSQYRTLNPGLAGAAVGPHAVENEPNPLPGPLGARLRGAHRDRSS